MVIGLMTLIPVANAQIQMGAKQSLPTKVATIAKVRESSNNQDEEIVDEPAAETEIEENGVQE